MNVSVVWFRRDLRLSDNEAVYEASKNSNAVLYVFLLDPWFFTQPELGLLRVRFLFESLEALDTAFKTHGQRLIILKGNSIDMMKQLLSALKSSGHTPTLFFNKDIQVAYGRERDEAILAYCNEQTIPVHQTNNYYLLDNEQEMDSWWTTYYEYQHSDQYPVPVITSLPKSLNTTVDTLPQLPPQSLASALGLQLPKAQQQLFVGGEAAARQVIYSFLKDRVKGYRWRLSRPMLAQRGSTSLLGPHLAFGTISNRTVFQAAENHMHKLETKRPKNSLDIAVYLDRLRWRDSFTQRLWFHPELMWENRFPEFDDIYSDDVLTGQQLEYFERWKNGETGFPLLDAAMRQLKYDGFINFRMRAMAATFLTINCQVSWHHGARHFMNCLVDGDIAINHWQWQMQAGITNPLSPTFRMYDPTKNFRERDPAAEYVHFWLPETTGMNIDQILKAAQPMLDFSATRKANGKIVADIRKTIRERIIKEKGIEFTNASTAARVVTNYQKHSAERYRRFAEKNKTSECEAGSK